MKTSVQLLKSVFTLSLWATISLCEGQNILYTRSELRWSGSKEPEKRAEALLIFDRASGELKGKVSLLPLVTNASLRDSLKNTNGAFNLLFSGLVPLAQPEFFSASENEKSITIDARYQIGDSVVFKPLQIILTMLRDKADVPPSAVEAMVLPCRANFVIQIDPARFGLNKAPVKWNRRLTVEVENGIINRQ